MPDIRVTCPTCKTQLEIDAAHEGEEVECGNCLQVFVATTKKPKDTGSSGSGGKVTGSTRSRASRDDDDEEEDERPRRRRRRDDDDDDDDDYDPRPRRRANQIANQPVAGLLLGGGVCALVTSLLWIVASGLSCCVWPGTWFAIIWGIFALINGSTMLNKRFIEKPNALLIMQIAQIVNLDIINVVLGIIGMTQNGASQRNRSRY